MLLSRRTLKAAVLLAMVACRKNEPPAGDKVSGDKMAATSIKVGGIFDLTGVTSDVGKSFQKGVVDCVQRLNEKGGINGKKIDLVSVDYGYKIPEAVAAYKRLVNDEKVVMINGWGTGDTEGLKNQVNADKIPYVSASFSAALTDTSKTPYNFFVGPSYSDQLRAWLKWVRDDWKRSPAIPSSPSSTATTPTASRPSRPAAGTPRRSASTWSTRRSCPAPSRTRPASSST